jgi:hypothetical protein
VYLGEPIRFVFEVRPRKRLVSLVAYLRLTKNGREVYHHLFRKHTLRGGVWRFVLNFHFTFTKDVGRLVAHYSTVTGVNAASTVPFTLKRRR